MTVATQTRPAVARRPIDAKALNLAVERARESWAQWSPARRPQARADHEAVLWAEVKHSLDDFWRSYPYGGDRDGGDRLLHEAFRLPRERAAAAALNALTHASVQTRLVREDMKRLAGAREAARDFAQSPTYRADWANRIPGARTDLENLIKRRRRDWQRALILIAAYQKETV